METKPQDADDAAFKLFEEVYADYVRKLGHTWDWTTKRILEAQKKLNEAGTGTPESPELAQKMCDSRQREYVEAVRAAWNESQRDYTAAYEHYVRAFRDAWAKTDAKGLSPMTMTIVTNSGTTAAGYATSTIGNWSLIAWAGVPPWVVSPDQPNQAASK